jgi:hypothetical protein
MVADLETSIQVPEDFGFNAKPPSMKIKAQSSQGIFKKLNPSRSSLQSLQLGAATVCLLTHSGKLQYKV